MKRLSAMCLALLLAFGTAGLAHAAGSGFKNEAAPTADSVTPLMPKAGVPPFRVYDESGDYVKMNRVVLNKTTVIVFYRGHWCPYCVKHLRELEKITSDLKALGVQLVAISPDKPARIAETRKDAGLTFPVYSDSTLEFARAMGVAYKLDSESIRQYGETLKESTGEETGQLPVPSVFIVRDGRITFTHWDSDYTKRLPNETLMAEVKKVVDDTAAPK